MSLLLLVATLMSLPGQATACACGPGHAARMSRQCPRCHDAALPAASPRLTRASCCKAKVTNAAAAVTPATMQLDRALFVAWVHAAMPESQSIVVAGARSARAPPGLDARPSTPPDSRSSILRL